MQRYKKRGVSMSAFIVEDETINRIVTWVESNRGNNAIGSYVKSALNKYGLSEGMMTFANLNKMANSFLVLNKLGVDAMYDEKNELHPMRFVREFAPDIQVLKSMHCLRYQCDEGEVHKQPGFVFLGELIRILTDNIINSLPEYEKAVWG